MHDTLHDLTRHHGGDVIGTRLPADAHGRIQMAATLIERAVDRWALQSFHAEMTAATRMMLDDQTDVEPLDMCLRISTTIVSISIGSHLVPIPLTASPVAQRLTVA